MLYRARIKATCRICLPSTGEQIETICCLTYISIRSSVCDGMGSILWISMVSFGLL